jgi:hypothetical protein
MPNSSLEYYTSGKKHNNHPDRYEQINVLQMQSEQKKCKKLYQHKIAGASIKEV